MNFSSGYFLISIFFHSKRTDKKDTGLMAETTTLTDGLAPSQDVLRWKPPSPEVHDNLERVFISSALATRILSFPSPPVFPEGCIASVLN